MQQARSTVRVAGPGSGADADPGGGVGSTRVLAVEDSDTQAGLLQAYLADARLAQQVGTRFEVLRVSDLAQAQEQLGLEHDFDVVLLDLTLPDSAGVRTLDTIRASTDLPVVVLSSDADAGEQVIAHGAQDFVVKDARSLPGLPRALQYAVVRAGLQEDLAAAMTARQEADERLRTFVSMASHELRSPIAALQGLATLLAGRWDQLDDDQRRRLAQRLDRRLGHTHAVATLYLNAAADEEGIHAVPEEVDLVELCEDVSTSVPVEPDEVDVAPGSIATFDASHLAAILVNLLTNAAKYGAAPVRLLGDGGALRVVDHGRGVGPAQVSELFVPWQRRARDGKASTGLGLALAAQLARANGAELSYERDEHAGTTTFQVGFGIDRD